MQNDAQSDCRALPLAGQCAPPTKTSSEASLTVKGRPVRAWLTSLGINLVPCSALWWSPWTSLYHPPECIPFEEILSACARERGCSLPCRAKQQASHACSLVALLAVQRCCIAEFCYVTRRIILLLHVCKGRCHHHAAFKSWMQSLSACLHAAFLYSTALLQILYACSLDLCPAALGFVSVTCVDKNRPQQSGTAGLVQADGCFSQLPSAMQHLIIYTFKRSRRKRCEWKPCRIVLKSQVRLARLQQVHRVSKALYRTDCFRGAASVLSLTQTFESLHIQSGRGQGLLQSCLRFLCAVMQSLQRQLSALAPIHRRLRPCLKV